jgi:sugar phosphate isomerase/epimerase
MLRGVGAAGIGAAISGNAHAETSPASSSKAGGAAERKFHLGLITYMVGAKWDLPTLIAVCKKTGVAALELRTTHAHGVEPSLSAEQRKEVRKRFEDSNGVVPWCLGSTCEFHSPDPAVVTKNIETCKQFIQLAADTGFKGVKVRPNGLRKDIPAEKTLEQIGKALIPCGEAAAAAGVEVWVEVHGYDTQKPPNIKQVMEHCGHKSVGLVWNSNVEDIKGGSIADSFKMLWPWIRSCHINDLWKDLYGGYPYRELFRLFREHGYDRYTMCEVPRTPADVAAGEDFLRYYRALWHELTKP